MQDQILGRLWVAHHEQFSSEVGKVLDIAATKARRFAGSVPTPLKAMAAVLAMSITSVVFATPSFAQSQIEVRAVSSQVSYADLNIGSAAGLATLRQRVRGAASTLCRPNLPGITGERIRRYRCFRTAIASAQPQIDAAIARRATAQLAAARAITITAR